MGDPTSLNKSINNKLVINEAKLYNNWPSTKHWRQFISDLKQ